MKPTVSLVGVSAAPEGRPGCAHCGAPVPASQASAFCCSGCQTTFEILREAGLRDGFVRMLEGANPAPRRSKPEASYSALDAPGVLEAHGRERSPGVYAVDFVLEGIHCAACLWLLEKLPSVCPGVRDTRLDVAHARLTVVFEPKVVALSLVATMLAELGYPPHLARDASRTDIRRKEDRALLMRIGVAFAVAANVMLMAAALYCGDRFGISPEIRRFLRWSSLVVTLPSLFFSAAPFFRGAWVALRTRTPHIDVPLTLSLAAGYVHGIVNTVRNSGEIYFDSVTALVFALLASRYVHRRKQREATDATELLAALAPAVAHRRDADGKFTDVPTSTVSVGDVIEVRAGEAFPVDGCVIVGSGGVDAALLTGESVPVEVTVGDSVHAGTVSTSAALMVRADATGTSTRLSRLTELMNDAASKRARIIELADRAGAYFVVIASVLAAVTVVVNWGEGPSVAFDRAVALLIVACPCALGLATPLAMSSAMASAARQRMLVKSSAALERLARVRTVVFDKTGTLTCGRLSLAHWFGDRTVQSRVRALEEQVSHPVGRALVAALPAGTFEVTDVEHVTGCGVSGQVDGELIMVGRPEWVIEATSADPIWVGMVSDLANQGLTPLLVARNGDIVGVAGLADQLRADAASTIAAIRQSGRQPRLLSGDDPRVVARVAAKLGIDAFEGGATPERKLDAVRELERHGPTAMVGDGVNDAPAMAASTVGIAVHGGAEASLAAADVYIDRPDVMAVCLLFRGAERARRVVRLGIALGAIYNVVGVALAMTGMVTPLMAAVLMPAASLTVVTLAHTMRTFGEPR